MFAAMPSVPPNKAVHYTFPYISQRFPNIVSNNVAYPRLHFSQPDVLNNGELIIIESAMVAFIERCFFFSHLPHLKELCLYVFPIIFMSLYPSPVYASNDI